MTIQSFTIVLGILVVLVIWMKHVTRRRDVLYGPFIIREPREKEQQK